MRAMVGIRKRAFPASIRLTQCEPKTALYCSSGRSSLRAATDSDSGAGRVRYRLRLEDGHSSSLIANGVTSAKQRGELSPQHGSLYEWTWDNLSPGPVHVIFCAEGDFDILDRVDVR
jgi:hypothetical protein